ncbi:selenide,water dikinase [Paraburkholderia sp. WC7.3g]|uniref:selenide, water dikinase SelD n=1 Tax=Paraburkholderia sp. WC7.3g TaxID=2991070 RepID=UPI003D202AE4
MKDKMAIQQIAQRFIDLATDAGCSKKADAGELTAMLRSVAANTNSSSIRKLGETFPDVGRSRVGDAECMATVDVLFPMVHEPEDFGRIVANHVLGDIYAAFGLPTFALAVVGIPYGVEASGNEVTEMMSGAVRELGDAGACLIGGHTLAKQSDLSLGFTVVGTPMRGERKTVRATGHGDPIFVTKRLGTSVATLLWKTEDAQDDSFQDAKSSMLQSNLTAARLLYRSGVTYCTDVTGFGLVNHLHRLMLRTESASKIFFDLLPAFASVTPIEEAGYPTSSLYFQNVEFASRFSNALSACAHKKSALLFDAQVAGGLLFTYPREQSQELEQDFEQAGIELFKIGNLKKGKIGEVTIL